MWSDIVAVLIDPCPHAGKKGQTISLLESGEPAIYGPQIWIMEALQESGPGYYSGGQQL